MNKTNLSLVLSVIALALSSSLLVSGYLSNRSIVYVDSNRLLNEYQGMVDARVEYQKKATSWKANIDTLQNEVTRSIMDYEKEVGKMTAKEKKLSQELIRTKQNSFKTISRPSSSRPSKKITK